MHDLTVSKIGIIKSQSDDIGIITAQLDDAFQLTNQLEIKTAAARAVDVDDLVNVSLLI